MKRVLTVGLALLLAVGLLAGCGGGSNSVGGNSGSDASGGAGKEAVKIGVLQLVGHPALDAAYDGFVDSLAEAGYVEGENLTFDYQNAQGDMANCPIMAGTLANAGCDLVLAIATPAAQAMAAATEEKQDLPVLVTAVTDPADAGLVDSNEAPGGNVSGTSDMTPVKEQMELLTKLLPDAKKVGFLYCSSEANSVLQIEMARAAAQELGLETQDFTVSNTNDVQTVAQSMVGKVDAVYIPTDNMIAQTMSTVGAISLESKLPLIVGEEGMVAEGGLASYSINYYELGKLTGQMAVEILQGKSAPAEMPIRYQENFDLVINEEVAEALGITIPADLA